MNRLSNRFTNRIFEFKNLNTVDKFTAIHTASMAGGSIVGTVYGLRIKSDKNNEKIMYGLLGFVTGFGVGVLFPVIGPMILPVYAIDKLTKKKV